MMAFTPRIAFTARMALTAQVPFTARVVAFAIGLGCWLASAAVGAESVLRQVEQAIRSSTSHQAADSAQRSAGPAGNQTGVAPAAGAASSLSDEAKQPGQPPPAGYLGAVADDSNDRGRGVRVIEVRPGSPAEKAGLKPQDLITGVAGTRVRELADMASILSLFAPGDTITLDVRRGEQLQQIKVTLGTRPGSDSRPPAPPGQAAGPLPQPPTEPAIPPPQQSPPGPVLKLPDSPECGTTPAPAATATPQQAIDTAELKSLIVQLQQRIDKLEARIARLEKALAEPTNKP